MKKSSDKQLVFVGMSGGVDSSTSAALLKEQGYDVTGVFIKVWQPPFLECRWPQDREDARSVAAQLGIPFRTIDLEDEYKQVVVDYMIEEYKGGRTPNPDVMCNLHIKFGAFFDWAIREGADLIATGHYARISQQQTMDSKHDYKLLRGVDENKDQTYFLWTLSQERLARTLFPVERYEKPEVRKLALRYQLPVADKKDSQGVCFLGKLDMKEFLSHYLDEKEGDVLDTSGSVIGKHKGAIFYTRGERRGFTLTDQSSKQEPVYVIDKDTENNTITVAPQSDVQARARVTDVWLESVNWIAGEKPENGLYQCRYRHRQPLKQCRLSIENGETRVTFEEPQEAVNPGQSLVVYDCEVCLGGGILSAIGGPQ